MSTGEVQRRLELNTHPPEMPRAATNAHAQTGIGHGQRLSSAHQAHYVTVTQVPVPGMSGGPAGTAEVVEEGKR